MSINATNARRTVTQQETLEKVDILWISRPPYPLKYSQTLKTKPTQHHAIGAKNQLFGVRSFSAFRSVLASATVGMPFQFIRVPAIHVVRRARMVDRSPMRVPGVSVAGCPLEDPSRSSSPTWSSAGSGTGPFVARSAANESRYLRRERTKTAAAASANITVYNPPIERAFYQIADSQVLAGPRNGQNLSAGSS